MPRPFAPLRGAHLWVAREHNQCGFSRLHCDRCQAIKPGQLWLDEYLQNGQIPKKCANTCGICLSSMLALGGISSLPCGHQHHRICLQPWIEINKSCPLCRKAAPVAPLGAAKPPSRRDGGIGPTDPHFNKMDRLTVPFQPLNAPLSCALLGRRS